MALPPSAFWLLALVLALGVPNSAEAQDTTIVLIGTRVRLNLVDSRPSGLMLAGRHDSVAFIVDADTQTVRRASIRYLERFTGRRSYKLRGALIGGTIAAVIGGLAARGGDDFCDPGPPQRCTYDTSVLDGAFVFGVLGAAIGTVLGIPSHDQWARVPPPWRVEEPTSGSE